MSNNGILLFSKEFFNSVPQPRLLGSLLIALLEKSRQTTGYEVSYIELARVAITVVGLSTKKLCCILFLDKDDGEELGRLFASEILLAFVDMYLPQNEGSFAAGAQNLSQFEGFNSHLNVILRKSVGSVLEGFQKNPAVKVAFIIENIYSDGEPFILHTTGDIDQFSILANVGEFRDTSINSAEQDQQIIQLVTFSGESIETSIVTRTKIENSVLIVIFSRKFDSEVYASSLTRTTSLLRKAMSIGSFLS